MIELLLSLSWMAVIVAAIVYFILGGLWYSPLLFADAWMKQINKTADDFDKPNPVIFLYSFILQLIATISLGLFISAMAIDTAVNGAIIGFGAGSGLLFTLSGATGIFSDTPFKLHLINNGYHVIGLTLAGLIIGWWI